MYILGLGQFISAGKLALQPSLYMPNAAMALLVLPGVVKVVTTLYVPWDHQTFACGVFFA